MSGTEKDLPLLRELIEGGGFGLGQLRVLVTGATVLLADGSELLLLTAINRALMVEWPLDHWQRGNLLSVVFVGVLIGNILSGVLGDRHGRRFPILLSLAGVLTFSIISALSQNLPQLLFARLLVGTSFGLGQPAYFALSGEITPSFYRLHMQAMALAMFALGEIYSAFLIWMTDPYLLKLDWRFLVCMGAIPSGIFLIIALLFQIESPSFLLVKGHADEARKTVHRILEANGHPTEDVDFKPAPSQSTGVMSAVKIVFGKRLRYSTMVVAFSAFTINFVYYGSMYAFPQVLPHLKLHFTPAANLLMGAVAAIGGYFLGTLLSMHMSRKVAIFSYCVSVAAFALMFSIAGYDHLVATPLKDDSVVELKRIHGMQEILVLTGLMGMKVCIAWGAMTVLVYAVEIYPTVARTTGNSLCIAAGRLGAILCPTIYEHLSNATGAHASFFHVMACLLGVNAILVLFLPFETSGQLLQDHEDESEPIAKSA